MELLLDNPEYEVSLETDLANEKEINNRIFYMEFEKDEEEFEELKNYVID